MVYTMTEVSEIDKKLNAILGVEYNEEISTLDSNVEQNNELVEVVEPLLPEITPISTNLENDQSDIDFEFARNNIKKLSDIGMENIEKLSYIARDSQTPRMFEVLSGMIKNISDINSNLVDMHNKKISSSVSNEETSNSTINVNQAVICTSTEALKRIKDRRNNK